MSRLFGRILPPFLAGTRGNIMRWLLLGGILLLITASLSLVVGRSVVLKMLPFDNKSEFQVVLDMPEGSSLEQTTRVLDEMSDYLAGVPEVTDYQVYSGTASPIGFNGLVRQYALREGARFGFSQNTIAEKPWQRCSTVRTWVSCTART